MKSKKTKHLSKSSLVKGFQCPKYLWLHLNAKDLASEVDPATQRQFDEGNEVGRLAQKKFKGGFLIDVGFNEIEKGLLETKNAIESGKKVIFEAHIAADDLYVRTDILKKGKRGWQLIEVKKGTSAKEEYVLDVAIQAFVLELAGLKLESVSLMYLNNKCVFPDLEDLFIVENVSKQVRDLRSEVLDKIDELREVAAKIKQPNFEIGSHCDTPYVCPFKEHCWKKVPEYSVLNLPSLNSANKWDLFDSGKKTIKQLSPGEFKGLTRRAIEVTKSGKTFVDSNVIDEELSGWEFPLYFFDYETIGPAIPRYKATRPYGQVPFQFSCHVWRSPKDRNLEHFEYLHQEATDPRPGIIKAMLEGFGSAGHIVAYNKGFEIGVIKSLAEFDRKNRKALLALIDRFVDPLPVFREAVYHPDFLGSFSIKNVAPALIGEKLSYDSLEIGDGSTAQAWAELILTGKISSQDKNKVVAHLLEYCRQDTLAMVELVKWLLNRRDCAFRMG